MKRTDQRAYGSRTVSGRFWVLCVLCSALLASCCVPPAAAESDAIFVFPYEGFRFEVPRDALVLTQYNLEEHAAFLAGLGTDAAAMQAGMQSAGVVLELFPAQGGQIQLSLAPAAGISGAGVSPLSEAERAALLAAYADMPRYREVSFSEEEPNWLRMVFSSQQSGLPVFTLRYITVAHGQQYLLSSVLIGRTPEAADDAQVLDIIRRISFLTTLATQKPTPTPEPTPEPTSTPKPTRGIAELLVEEPSEEVFLSVAPLPAWTDQIALTVTGTTASRATVRMLAAGKQLAKVAAGVDGSFTLNGTLGASGNYEVIIEASLGRNRVASQTYAVCLEAPRLWLQVTEPTEPLQRKEVVVKGKTAPGAKIDIRGNGLVTNVRANANGDFSFRVKLLDEGKYEYSLTATLKGYEPYTTTCTVVREFSYPEALAAFRKSLIPLDYNRLVNNPAVFDGKRASCRAHVAAVGDMDGVPCMLLDTRLQNGVWDRPMWALCTDAPPYAAGEVFTAYLQMNGELMPYTDASGKTVDLPVAELRFHAK